MRLMVTGSRERSWKNHREIKRGILSRLQTFPLDTIVMQGGADGVDQWTREACEITGHACVDYLPHPGVPSPQRYHQRNDKMLDVADEVLAVWDGKSDGTGGVIKKAKKRRIRLWVWRPE